MNSPDVESAREPTNGPVQPTDADAVAEGSAGIERSAAQPAAEASPQRPASPALDLGVAVALASALVYTAGWAYAYRWFARFDLGIAGLGLPGETFLMYGFWTLRAHWYLLLLYGLGLALWFWHGAAVRLWILRTAPVWLLGAFGIAYLAGAQQANSLFERHRDAGFGCFPTVRLGLAPQDGRSPEIEALAEDLAEREYRLLLQAPSLLVLIKPKSQGPPVTALVPLGRVEALRLNSTLLECQP